RGEAQRIKIGLDMIAMSDLYLFDEPTSGLSSKDSEHVIEIIRSMAHNKIIIVTIHQPSSKLFQLFHKAILLDKGGRLVFFGTPTEMLRYFAEAEHQHQFGADLGACPSCGTTRPEFIFDVLETPLRDLSGDIIYEENSRGQLVAARRYSPEFWRDKYEAFRLIQDVKQVSLLQEPVAPLPAAPIERKRLPIRWHDEWTQYQGSPVVLRHLQNPHARRICLYSVRPVCPYRQFPPANPRNVLVRPGDHVHDCDEWRRTGPAHLFPRGRPEDGGQYRPAGF